ncbi:unnamed protein product [Phytophthora fragariaefolia]|uniref:Unnamed protein product n=1 Tax=Phytophthora fragariaefolia TaxID=1490495 RepID=A0A9W6U980_9STRA|nr:unnamed protein product [Phytophthora fragariaefolia]
MVTQSRERSGDPLRTSTNFWQRSSLRATLDVAPKTGTAPARVKVESAPEAPARKRPDVRSERKAETEGETRRIAQPDAAKRAKPASAKSAERKGRDASSQNNKSKKTLKHRGSSDKSESDSSFGGSDQDSDRSESSSREDVVPNVPTVAGPGGMMFTFRPYVNASARGLRREGVACSRDEVVGEIPEHRTARRLDGQRQDLRDEAEAVRRRPELACQLPSESEARLEEAPDGVP